MTRSMDVRLTPPVSLLSAFSMFVCLALGYWHVLQRMALSWDSGDNSYGYLVVPLFLYLCWEKRETFRFLDISWSIAGVTVVLLAAALVGVGEAGSMETLLFIGIWIAIVGILLTLYGRRIQHLLFPLLILFFIVPLPPYINRTLTFQLKLLASSLSAGMLRASGVSVLMDGNILDLGVAQLQVVDACSGLRYVMPMLLTALLIAHFFLKSRWRQAVILALAIPLTVAVNSLRIWITGLLTVHGQLQFTTGDLHDTLGLVMFFASSVLLAGLAMLLRERGGAAGREIPKVMISPVGTLRPLVLTVLLSAIFLGTGWALPRLQPEQTTAPLRQNFAAFPMQLGRWEGARQYLAPEVLEALWADDYVSARFTRSGSANLIHLLIPYYEYQGTRHTAHAPQSCLLGSGWAVLQTRERTFAGSDGRSIPVTTMELKKGSETVLAAYFFLGRGRVITDPWRNKFYLMLDAVTQRRTDGALVRAEMVVAPGQSQEEAFVELAQFLSLLWHELPAYVPGEESHHASS